MATTTQPPTGETGHSLLAPWSSFIMDDETVPALMWPNSIRTYHKMRMDSQVDALTKSITLPLRRLRWAIEPNGARDEVVEQIASDLGLPIRGVEDSAPRGRRRFNYDEYLRHSILALWYGHIFFEQVPDTERYDLATDGWRLRKLAPRLPQSITEIKAADDGGLKYIKQHDAKSHQGKTLSVDRLVAFVWEREGANWLGRSMLRPLYRPWLLKDRLLRIDTIKHERFGVGIPTGKAPPGGNPADYARMAREIRATEDGGVGLPAGADVGVEGIRGSLPDTMVSVRYHDESMARSFMAMVIQLGQTETGSRALGETFVGFFQLAVDAIADWHAATTSEHVVEDMVDWNWGVEENAPLVVWDEPEESNLAVEDLATLIETGVLTVDGELQSWVRERHKLPPASENAPPVAVGARRRRGPKAVKQTLGDPVIGHREPLDHEVRAATDFAEVQQVWQNTTEDLVGRWAEVRAVQIDSLVEQVRVAAAAGDTAALANLTAPVLGTDLLHERMLALAEDSVTAARAEAAAQGVVIPLLDVTDELDTVVRANAQAVAALNARAISDSAARNAVQRYGAGVMAPEDVAAGVREHLDDLSDAYLVDQLGGALTMAQNTARAAVMSKRSGTFYASELLDQNTCTNCSSIDGREYGAVEDAIQDYPSGGHKECLGGPRCRGTIVAVYDEAEATQ